MKALPSFLSLIERTPQKSEREYLREKRKTLIEKSELLGGPPFRTEHVMEKLVEFGLQEAELIDGFEPDLLIVSPMQYKELANIPAGVPIDPDRAVELGADKQGMTAVQPPMFRKFGDYHIDVTYSHSANEMVLVDSSKL